MNGFSMVSDLSDCSSERILSLISTSASMCWNPLQIICTFLITVFKETFEMGLRTEVHNTHYKNTPLHFGTNLRLRRSSDSKSHKTSEYQHPQKVWRKRTQYAEIAGDHRAKDKFLGKKSQPVDLT